MTIILEDRRKFRKPTRYRSRKLAERGRFHLAAKAFLFLAIAALLGACSHPGVQFYTTLGSADELAAGNPVTHAGSRIGQVTDVRPDLYGTSFVNFSVEQSNAGLVHTDSIMVLRDAGVSPELELENPNPLSASASAGSQITGASSEAEANAIRTTHAMSSYAMGLAQFLSTLNSGPNPPPINSAAIAALTAQLLTLQQQATMRAYMVNPASRQRMKYFIQQLENVQQQLQKSGMTAQAMQLQQQIDSLKQSMTAVSGAPNTLTTPRVYPNPSP